MNILAPIVVVPFICYYFDNWLLLFGSVFIWLGKAVSSHKKTKYVFFLPVAIGGGIFWVSHGFDIHTELTFYIICFLFGFLCYQLYRTIGFGDRLSRGIIVAQGNRDAGEEISEEVEKDTDKMVWDVVKEKIHQHNDFNESIKSASSELGISEIEIVTRISRPKGAPELIKQLKQTMEEKRQTVQAAKDWVKSTKSDS